MRVENSSAERIKRGKRRFNESNMQHKKTRVEQQRKKSLRLYCSEISTFGVDVVHIVLQWKSEMCVQFQCEQESMEASQCTLIFIRRYFSTALFLAHRRVMIQFSLLLFFHSDRIFFFCSIFTKCVWATNNTAAELSVRWKHYQTMSDLFRVAFICLFV